MSKFEFWYDLETTGLDPEKNGIYQVSFLIYKDGELLQEFDRRIQPMNGDEIDVKALAVNSVTLGDLSTYSLPIEFYYDFKDIIQQYISPYDKQQKMLQYGYNVRFDESFLRKFFEKNGDKYFGSLFWYPPIDVMNLAMEYLKDVREKLPNFKQGTVAKALGLDVDEDRLHDSSYDIEVCRQIYQHITKSQTK